MADGAPPAEPPARKIVVIDVAGKKALVIGTAGANIRALCTNYRVLASFDKEDLSSQQLTISQRLLKGGVPDPESDVDGAALAIRNLIAGRNSAGGNSAGSPAAAGHVEVTVDVTGKEGVVIGKGGLIVRRLQDRYSVQIQIDGGIATITGAQEDAEACAAKIEEMLEDADLLAEARRSDARWQEQKAKKPAKWQQRDGGR